jgi:PAS domain S-box-containing protein
VAVPWKDGMEAIVPSVRSADTPAGVHALAPTVGMSIAMVVTAAIGVISILSNRAALETSRWVDHTHRLLQLAADTGAAVAEAEAQRRAHALTGDPDQLMAFDQEVARAAALAGQLRAESADNPGQQRRVAAFELALGQHVQLMRRASAEQAEGVSRQREIELTRRGVRGGAEVRDALAEFAPAERALLAVRLDAEVRRVRSNRVITVASAVAALILVGLAFALVRREMQRRNRVEAMLRGREEALDRTLAAIPDAILIVDRTGTITRVNDHAPVLFGYPRGELVGRPVEMLVPARQRAQHTADRAGYVAAPSPRRMGAGVLDLFAVHRNGDEIPVDISLSPLRTADGLFTITAVRDVSARLAEKDELRRMHSQAQIANRELEAFSYSVAHDLRTPLRSIDGFSQALLEDCGPQLGADGQDHLRRVRAAAQRMARLIDDLLGLSRVTRSEVQRSRVDLSALAHDIVERLREAALDRRVAVDIADGIVVDGDSRLLQVALQNLLENAWKFTAGRDDARITMTASRDDGQTVVHIADNGVGFDMSYIDKLFGVFQRLHAHAQFEGTGVGLATVQRIIQRHGGRIWAEGVVGGGATFHFAI